MKAHTVAAFLGLGSRAYAQLSTSCISDQICFSLNIPSSTVSSGSGDIYFQITAPSSLEWVALGQGSGMVNANIFVVYSSANGQNVTVSPRMAQSHIMPTHNSGPQITLLEGSGISGDTMTANVRCANCNKWSGGTMDFTADSAQWIYASHAGTPVKSDSLDATINFHGDTSGSFNWPFSSAKGGNSVNPFSSAGSTGSTGSTTPSNTSGGGNPINFISSDASQRNQMLIAHGVLAALAFVIFFPAGAISIRIFNFPGLVWFHAATQIFAYAVFIAAFGLGVHMVKSTPGFTFKNEHPIIGIVVFCLLFLQPILGFIHHAMFKRYSRRTFWSYVHLWLGRIIITLGIINGGLGLRLAGNTRKGEIAYGVVAGIIWMVYMMAAVYGEVKKARNSTPTPPHKYRENSDGGATLTSNSNGDIPQEYYGHRHK